MSRKHRITLLLLLPLLGFGILIAVLGLGLGNDPQALPSARLGRPMPEFALPGLLDESRTVTSEDLTGQIALVNVWGTWCPACYDEHPSLMKLSEQGVPIYGVNYKDERDKALRWLEDLGNPYALNVQDRDGRFAIDLGVYGAPETYLLDQNAVIRYRHVGVVTDQVWQEIFLPQIAQIQGRAQ